VIRKALPRVLEVVALIVFVLVVRDNFRLRKMAASAALAATRANGTRLFQAGDTITEVQAFDVAGTPRQVSFREGRSLVAVVDPTCDSCKRVISGLPADGSAVVLSMAAPEAFRQGDGKAIRGRIYSIDPMKRDPRLATNPQVLLVDNGRVVRTCAEPAGCV
jgi:uncharacterized membrane protein